MSLRTLWSELRYRIRAIVSKQALDQELEDELAHHLQKAAEALIAQGHSPEEARRLARVAIGGLEPVRHDSRQARGVAAIDALRQDIRLAARGLLRRPGFALAVIGTIALGIAANAAIFHVADRMLLRAPSLLAAPAHTHRLVEEHLEEGDIQRDAAFAYKQLLDFRNFAPKGVQLTGYARRTLPVGSGTNVRELPIVAASANYFPLFDARPTLGRFYTPAEDTISNPAMVAVVSYAFWQAELGATPAVLETNIKIGKGTYRIVGVAPPRLVGLDAGEPPVAWIPLTSHATVFRDGDASFQSRYSWSWLKIVARRDPQRSVQSLQTDLTRALGRSFEEARLVHPKLPPLDKIRPRMLVGPIQESRGPIAGTEASVLVWVAAVAAVVLLIACINVTNLLLGRALSRTREVAVRRALGVRNRRLVATLLTESQLLFALGGLLGVGLGYLGAVLLTELFIPGATAPSLFDVRVLAFCGALAVAAAVATTLVPALGLRGQDLQAVFRGGMKEGMFRRSRLRSVLLTGQGALSVVLLVAAALFVRSILHARAMRLGFDAEQLLVVSRQQRAQQFDSASAAQNARELEAAAIRVPGVESASRALTIPLADTWSTGIFVTGVDSVNRLGKFTLQAGSASFFQTAGTRIVRGRGLSEDDRATSPRVAVISESMARTIWPGRDALGQCMRVEADTMPCTTIVGISEDLRQESLTGPPELTFYLPIEQFHPEGANVFVRTRAPATIRESVRRALQPLMPGDAYISVRPATEAVAPHLKSWQAAATILSVFGLIALGLASVGLYSVTAFDVARRTHELGVRAALGARRGTLLRMILGEGLRLSVIGVAIGVALSMLLGRELQPLLFRQAAWDVGVYVAVAAALFLCATLASLVPSLRAARLSPNIALRTD